MIYWNQVKAKYLLLVTWAVSVIACISISITNEVLEEDALYPLYIYVGFDVFVIGLSSYTYGYIFKRYCMSKMMISRIIVVGCAVLPTAGESIGRPSLLRIFRKSTFYIPCLLIINFSLLRLAPDLLHFMKPLFGHNIKAHRISTEVPIKLSNLLEVYIYVFVQKSVRRLFWRKISKRNFCCKNNAVGAEQTSVVTD